MQANSDASKHQDSSIDAMTTDESGQIKLLIRTARVQKFIEVNDSASIKDLRQKAADAFEVGDPVLTVLIFGGKILKDHEDMKTHGIRDGQTIHLVIRNKPANPDNPTMNSTNSSQSSNQNTSFMNPNNDNIGSNFNNNNITNSNNNNTRPTFPSMNPLSGNLGEVQQRLQQMLISNPETMQNMINPLMQQMMSNPDTIRSLFGSMQRMHSLMERNPEVNHLLSNPDVLRESLEMVRNPAALQEVMRNYDRALNNMESMPGGYNVLRRMYTEFQEPLLSAFQENTNQFTAQQNTGDNSSNQTRESSDIEQQRTENRDPLPNPWAPQAPTSNSHGDRQPPFNLGSLLGQQSAGGLRLPGRLGAFGNLGANTDIGSALGSALGATMESMGLPNMTDDLLQRYNTLFRDDEFRSLLTHPEALQSVMQIQQGLEGLRRIAPNLFDRLGFPVIPGMNLGTNTDNNNGGGGGATNQSDKSEKDKNSRQNPDDKHDGH